MTEEDRVKAVREVRRMTTAQLLEWRVRRAADDSFRVGLVDWELKSRANAAVYKAAIAAGLGGRSGGVAHLGIGPLLVLTRQSLPPRTARLVHWFALSFILVATHPLSEVYVSGGLTLSTNAAHPLRTSSGIASQVSSS
jgi:hypothetical protein